jgi:hypothetical protein
LTCLFLFKFLKNHILGFTLCGTSRRSRVRTSAWSHTSTSTRRFITIVIKAMWQSG